MYRGIQLQYCVVFSFCVVLSISRPLKRAFVISEYSNQASVQQPIMKLIEGLARSTLNEAIVQYKLQLNSIA